MAFTHTRSVLPRSAFVYVVLLFLFVVVNAGKIHLKQRPVDSNVKVDKQTCDKILPVVSRQQKSDRPDRIVNGEDAPNMKFYMGALVNPKSGAYCSATLLSEYWVLTAAHCVIQLPSEFVRVGGANANEGTDIEIEQVFIHPKYQDRDDGLRNDVQLVKLKSAVPNDSKFFVLNSDSSHPAVRSFTRTCGYGDSLGTASPEFGVLREVDVPVVGQKRCQRQYKNTFDIRKRMHICAGYDEGGCDSCQGDSGGPLFTVKADGTPVQVGIVSFGANCAEPQAPGVYARVSQYIEWMRSVGAEFTTTTDGIDVFTSSDIPTESSTPTPTPTPTPEPVTTSTPDPVTPTPLPTPTPEVSFFDQLITCFTRSNFVTTEGGEKKKMTQLSAGERVRFGRNGDAKIFEFKEEDNGKLKFLQVECEVCETLIAPFCSA